TLDDMRKFNQRHLTQAALGLAKISETEANLRTNAKNDTRHLSNLAYANAVTGTVARLKDGRTATEYSSLEQLSATRAFQHVLGVSNPAPFDQVVKEILARDHMGTFKPQELWNILLAYSKAGVQSSNLFDKVANYAIGLGRLVEFKLQECSNMVWSFAEAGESEPRLFQKVADHILGLNGMHSFKPQNLSNTRWVFARADISNPSLFQKVADHIIDLYDLNTFNRQELPNIVWAFAKLQLSSPSLFQTVADHIISFPLQCGHSQRLRSHIPGFSRKWVIISSARTT
ncbi:hypothetical protein ACHAWF_002217, partial [Thalassiosira exigua]